MQPLERIIELTNKTSPNTNLEGGDNTLTDILKLMDETGLSAGQVLEALEPKKAFENAQTLEGDDTKGLRQGYKIQAVDGEFVPSNNSNNILRGNKSNSKRRGRRLLEPFHRTNMVLESLEFLNVAKEDIEGPFRDNSYEHRKNAPYKLVVVKGFDKTILVNDTTGYATYIIHSTDDPKKYASMNIAQLQELVEKNEATCLKGFCDDEEWQAKLVSLLKGNLLIDNPKYFENGDNVRADLKQFAKLFLDGDSPLDLASNYNHHPHYNSVLLSNGEGATYDRYIRHAAVAYGLAENCHDTGMPFADTLHKLLEKAGYQELNEKYFDNRENVKADLGAFFRVADKAKSVFALTTHTILDKKIICHNGQELSGLQYLFAFAKAIGKDIKSCKVVSYSKELMAGLLRHGGYKPMTESYYTPETVFEDLSLFLRETSKSTIANFAASDFLKSKAPFVWTNGEPVSPRTYLLRAGVHLGLAKKQNESGKNYKNIIKTLIAKALEYSPDESSSKNPS